MSIELSTENVAHLDVKNIGGISDTSVEIRPGVTVLQGRNATNRTSLLQAIMAACGSEQVTLKGDANEGLVELTIGETKYTRHLSRENGSITFDGYPHLEDSIGADRFAFLLESNEARRAVERGDDLRDVIMEPVDTHAIQAEITRLEAEKHDLKQQLETWGSLEDRLPKLEDRRQRLQDKLEAKERELEAKKEELEATEASVEQSREEKSDLEAKLDELRDVRSRLEDIRYEIDTQQESIERLQDENEPLKAEYKDFPEIGDQDPDDISAKLTRLRNRKSNLESDLSDLQRLISFNEEMIEDSDTLDTIDEAGPETDESDLSDQLLVGDNESITCWTCGSTVERKQIESTVDRLQELHQQKLGTINELEADIDELRDKRTEIIETRERRDELEERLAQIEDDIEERRERLEELRSKRKELTNEIDSLETEVEQLEEQTFTEVLDIHKTVNQLELDRERIESDLDETNAEIADIEKKLERRQQIHDQLEEINGRLTDLRTRIEQLEAQAIEQFNEHMQTLLARLNFDNIDRIWLERREDQVRDGRQTVEKTIFELHVVRTTESGSTYEDTVDHLSESEREVTGLVFALAGYLTHSIYESVPFMVLDSLEALDADRIADLVDYVREYAPYLVVALLPEDAAALDDEYTYVTEI